MTARSSAARPGTLALTDARELRRRWVVASTITLVVHGLVFLGLARTPQVGLMLEPASVDVTLERLHPPQPVTPPRPAERPVTPSPLPLHQPPSDVASVQGNPLPAGPMAVVTGAVANAAEPGTAPTPALKLKLDCLTLGPPGRSGANSQPDCKPQRFAKLNSDNPAMAVPANPAWDAQIAKQMQVHQPLPPERPNRNDCAGGNLGLGCTEDMLIPLVKRKF